MAAKDDFLRALHEAQAGIATTEEWHTLDAQGLLLRRYYRPLVALAQWVGKNGNTQALALLLEESTRFVDRFLPLPEQYACALRLLEAWERLASGYGDSLAAQGLARARETMVKLSQATPVRLVGIGDCLLSDVRTFLRLEAAARGVAAQMGHLYLSAVASGEFDPAEALSYTEQQHAELVAISFFTYDGIPAYRLLREGRQEFLNLALDQVRRFLDTWRARDARPLLLHGVCGLPLVRRRELLRWLPPLSPRMADTIARLDAALHELSQAYERVLWVDERALAQTVGLRQANEFVADEGVFAEAFFHVRRFGAVVASHYAEVLDAFVRARGLKVIAVDFDNTLWQGVMAEGEVKHWYERQERLKRLREGGILLVALSKNDPERIRWDEMRLKPEDFVALRIGWDLKPTVLPELAQQLNLGLDAFAFIDDNPTERGLMQQHCPQVRVWDATDPFVWRMLEWLEQFPAVSRTEEARQRTEMYRAQVDRQRALASANGPDSEAMLRALELVLEIHPMRPDELARVHELAQRTNQFNTTTIRYREAELTDPKRRVWVGYLRDRFGSHGLVLVAVLRPEGEGWCIEDVIMSCRAMGFGAETTFLAHIAEALGRPALHGEFRPTERNAPAASYFARCGFEERTPGHWVLAAGNKVQGGMPWIRVEMQR